MEQHSRTDDTPESRSILEGQLREQYGRVVAAAEEERFSRIKHDSRFPTRAIRFCLTQWGIAAGDLDYVAFFEKPFLKFDRILQTAVATVPRSSGVFRQAMTTWR